MLRLCIKTFRFPRLPHAEEAFPRQRQMPLAELTVLLPQNL